MEEAPGQPAIALLKRLTGLSERVRLSHLHQFHFRLGLPLGPPHYLAAQRFKLLGKPMLNNITTGVPKTADEYVQLKCKCTQCSLHFVICTEHPERHSVQTIYCPECGKRGDKVVYVEAVQGAIGETVPGRATAMLVPQG